MKNEQENTQNGKQEQSLKIAGNKNDGNQPKGDEKQVIPPPGYRNEPSSSQSQNTGNTAVGKDGKIGKAHDDKDWGKNEGNKDNSNKGNEKSNQVRSDKTVTEPEIDAPIYDPEKTEKKIPQMGGNK